MHGPAAGLQLCPEAKGLTAEMWDDVETLTQQERLASISCVAAEHLVAHSQPIVARAHAQPSDWYFLADIRCFHVRCPRPYDVHRLPYVAADLNVSVHHCRQLQSPAWCDHSAHRFHRFHCFPRYRRFFQ